MAVPNFEAATGSGARGTGGTVRPAPDLAASRADWVSQGCSVLLPPVSLLVVGEEWYSRRGGSSGQVVLEMCLVRWLGWPVLYVQLECFLVVGHDRRVVC
jgi:hypothetical protein